jgi:glycine/D-amino acid oxidase-like deaminating enzyme/nitrite reductase/ring-hydroxylating ferredoxin subunit
MPRVPRLHHDLKCDVCVVGAGMAGLSVAYELLSAGKKVVVIDDGKIAGGQTQVTTSHLVNALDHRYEEIERVRGEEVARLAAESHTAAINRIGDIALQEGIACEFERLNGYLFLPADGDPEMLDKEFEAARRTGIVRIERAQRAPIDSFDTGPCLRFRGQGQMHPLMYLAGVARVIVQRGGEIYSSTHAESVEGGDTAKVQTKDGVVTSSAVVVATNVPVNDLLTIHTKQAPYMTYAIAARLTDDITERALMWDTADPFHYVRFRTVRKRPGNPATNLVIVGGEDHKSGQANDGEERHARLEAWTRERFPSVGEVEYRWAGQVMNSHDGLAYIGRNPGDKENVFISTGDSGNGMTHGAIAGMLISDLILGKDNPWAQLYDPSRVPVKAFGQFLKEAGNMALQYGAWVTPGEVNSLEQIKKGEGAILRQGLKKLAVYRDENGTITKMSAACPHLGCVVGWNSVEQTWDCPCHGSRFTSTGEILNGPANSDLPKEG